MSVEETYIKMKEDLRERYLGFQSGELALVYPSMIISFVLEFIAVCDERDKLQPASYNGIEFLVGDHVENPTNDTPPLKPKLMIAELYDRIEKQQESIDRLNEQINIMWNYCHLTNFEIKRGHKPWTDSFDDDNYDD